MSKLFNGIIEKISPIFRTSPNSEKNMKRIFHILRFL